MTARPVWYYPSTARVALLLSLIGVGFGPAGCARVHRARGRTTLRFFAQGYTPRHPTRPNEQTPTYLWRLEREYHRLHPEVNIEFVGNVVGDYDIWLTTQMIAGRAPDIAWEQAGVLWEQSRKGWWLSLDPYLERPNRYVPGNRRWLDLLNEEPTEARRAPDGHLYVLPLDLVETGIYYNKRIFREVGVKPPKTWDEFMKMQAKIKRAGYVPFAFDVGRWPMRMSWAYAVIQDMVLDSKVDAIRGEPGTGEGYGNAVTEKQLVRAIKRGVYSARDPQFQEVWRIIKDWSQYFHRSFLGGGDVYRMFVTEKAAMLWDGSWQLKPLRMDPLREFEFGVFYVPRITKATTRYATGAPARGVGGASAAAQYCIPATTRDRGKLEAAVDWLMFMSTPEHAGAMVQDLGEFVPNVKGAPVSAEMKPFMAALGHHVRLPLFDGLGPDFGDRWYKLLQAYLGDEITLDEAMDRLQRDMEGAADEAIRRYHWNFDDTATISERKPTRAQE
jgi:raffinose/stachyose/melibiose transport system substrate-binding protein